MSTKRISFFTSSMSGGGAERVWLDLATRFAEDGYAVDLVLMHGRGAYLKKVPDCVSLHILEQQTLFDRIPIIDMLCWLWRLRRYMLKARPHSMLCTLRYPNGMAGLVRTTLRHKPRLYIREACVIDEKLAQFSPGKRWLAKLKTRLTYPLADGVIVMSDAIQRDVMRYAKLPAERCHKIGNPTVTPALQALKSEPLEHPWFQPAQPPVIIAAGRLVPQKGFDILIDAFAKLHKTHASRLLILGEGPERSALQAQIDAHQLQDHAALAGFVENPFHYMANASLYVLSSRFEGLPNTLIQAMACGCPVVATDCSSGTSDILNEEGLGPIVAMEDAQTLAIAMQQVLETPPEKSRLIARANAYHIDHIFRDYAALLELPSSNASPKDAA